MKMARVLALSASAAFSLGLAAPGDPDQSFGTNGSVDLALGASDDALTSLLLRSDGKLIAVGRIGDDIGLARYEANGALDSSFGTNGLARYRRPDTAAHPLAAAEQPDGKVVVLAACGAASSVPARPCLYRFNVDGTRDATLQPDAAAAIDGLPVSGFNDMAVLSDGRILITLQFSESPEYRSLIGNEVYVTMVYVGMLRRAPDAGGFSYWVSYMDAGNPGLALTGAFVAAGEYRARFLP